MDLGIIGGIALLVAWAVGTFVLAVGGWIHLLLTLGVFVVIWRIIVQGTPGADMTQPNSTSPSEKPRR